MAEEMLPVLDQIHATVAGELEHEPEMKTIIELMPNHRWFAVRITGMPAIHTIAAATGPVIAMEAPKVGPDHSGEYDWPAWCSTNTRTPSRSRARRTAFRTGSPKRRRCIWKRRRGIIPRASCWSER